MDESTDGTVDGYRVDLPYTINYFGHLSPSDIVTAARAGGVRGPDIEAPFTYLDLGCGRALALLVYAAAYPQSRFYGVDLNPEHIAECRQRAEAAGLENIEFFECSFDDPVLDDLPKIDLLVANGVFTWVPGGIGTMVLDRAANMLSDEGLFRITYYTPAGYAQMAPVTAFMREILRRTNGTTRDKTRGIAKLLVDLLETKPQFFAQNPVAAEIVKDLAHRDPAYIAHEYLNDTWRLISFADMAQEMRARDLHFCGDSRYPVFAGTDAAKAFGKQIQVSSTLEEMASLCTNERYRRDVYCRTMPFKIGRPGAFTQTDRYALSRPTDFQQARESNRYSPISLTLAEHCQGRPRSAGELQALPPLQKVTPFGKSAHLRNAVSGDLLTRVSPDMPDEAPPRPARERLSTRLAEQLIADDDIARRKVPLPSARMGGAVEATAAVAAALHTLNDGPADDWRIRTFARMQHLYPKQAKSDPKTQQTVADAVCRSVGNGAWGDLLRRAGVLVPD